MEETKLYGGAPGRGKSYALGQRIANLNHLSTLLGFGQAKLKQKRGTFRPRVMAVMVALAHKCEPPPGLVVQFDCFGKKTTYPVRWAEA